MGSRHSLGSIWVRKELEAADLSDLPVLLVLARDPQLEKLVREVAAKEDWAPSFARLKESMIGGADHNWSERAEHFLHDMKEYLRKDPPLLVFESGELRPLDPGAARSSLGCLREMLRPSTSGAVG